MWASQPPPDSLSPKLNLGAPTDLCPYCASQPSCCGDWEPRPLTPRPRALFHRGCSRKGDLQALHTVRRGVGTKHPHITQPSLPPAPPPALFWVGAEDRQSSAGPTRVGSAP